jgi:membrane protease YdiL (CAAX protease family)
MVGRWESAAGTNFIPGSVMVIVALAVIVLGGRSFASYGLNAANWKECLNLGLLGAVLLIVTEAIGVKVTGVQVDVGRPADPHAEHQMVKLLLLAAAALPGRLAVLWLVQWRSPFVRRIPVGWSLLGLFLLLAVGPLLAAHAHHPNRWPAVLWLFFGAGFGEEIFYRGYIQSRIDEASGWRGRALGFEFGAGLFVSAVLFGVLHALNTVDYFHGRFDFGWSGGVQATVEGLFFGCVRAKTGSVWTGAVLHGLGDVLVRLPNS